MVPSAEISALVPIFTTITVAFWISFLIYTPYFQKEKTSYFLALIHSSKDIDSKTQSKVHLKIEFSETSERRFNILLEMSIQINTYFRQHVKMETK